MNPNPHQEDDFDKQLAHRAMMSHGWVLPKINVPIEYNGNVFRINEDGVVEVLINNEWDALFLNPEYFDLLPVSLKTFLESSSDEDENLEI